MWSNTPRKLFIGKEFRLWLCNDGIRPNRFKKLFFCLETKYIGFIPIRITQNLILFSPALLLFTFNLLTSISVENHHNHCQYYRHDHHHWHCNSKRVWPPSIFPPPSLTDGCCPTSPYSHILVSFSTSSIHLSRDLPTCFSLSGCIHTRPTYLSWTHANCNYESGHLNALILS